MATDTRRVPKKGAFRSGKRPQRRPTASTITLTGRGGVVVIAAFTLFGAVLSAAIDPAEGFCFVLGCLLAAVATRRADLVTLVVSPPLIFFCVSLLTAALGSLGESSFVMSLTLTVATRLTSNVPWLFLGSMLVIVIAVPRGLPGALRELRRRVAADNPFRGRKELTGVLHRRKRDDDQPVRWDH